MDAFSQHVFADAGFAQDQDRQRRWCDAERQLVHALHLWIFEHEICRRWGLLFDRLGVNHRGGSLHADDHAPELEHVAWHELVAPAALQAHSLAVPLHHAVPSQAVASCEEPAAVLAPMIFDLERVKVQRGMVARDRGVLQAHVTVGGATD
jgi:hypothetical protein